MLSKLLSVSNGTLVVYLLNTEFGDLSHFHKFLKKFLKVEKNGHYTIE